jgi:hypothetical protein
LTLHGADYPKTRDVDFLRELVVDTEIKLPDKLMDAGWSTPWGAEFRYEEAPLGALDRDRAVAIAETAVTSFEDVRRRLGTEPGTLADFEAEYGSVGSPDGEQDLRWPTSRPATVLAVESIQRASKPSKDAAAEAEAVRLNRLREDAQRPMSVNLAETIALSHALLKMAAPAQRQ